MQLGLGLVRRHGQQARGAPPEVACAGFLLESKRERLGRFDVVVVHYDCSLGMIVRLQQA